MKTISALSLVSSLLLLNPYQCHAESMLRAMDENNESLVKAMHQLLERVSLLEQQVSSLQQERTELIEQVNTVQEELAQSTQQHERRLQDSCIFGDSKSGGSFIIDGCNLVVRSGTGKTTDSNGLGNVIVGYNEADSTTHARTGSHNVVVGVAHGYKSHSGIVSGRSNDLHAPEAVALGGHSNAVDGEGGAVLGGNGNVVRGKTATCAGGENNLAASLDSCTFGGGGNIAQGQGSVVVGGKGGQAVDLYSVAVGGF